ncbi:MAG TPA: urease accessory UreF family protein [Methylomirabilota bacterium]|jgi:urease accessory protein|nr:urease accessory UreF family protein [Methylomirabilota bacterium]
MDTEALLAVLQLADGLFPAGGFAHSFGLETYAQEGRVRDREGLDAFVVAHLEGAAGPADAVAVAVAARLAATGDLAAWSALDARLDAMKPVPEFRAASRQMGRQTARVAAALRDDAFLAALARAVDDGLTPGHHAAVFGAAAGRSDAEPEAAAAAYLYSTAALLVGAGLRLLTLGQLDGQRVLAAARPRVARLAAAAARATVDDMWTFTPALELAGLRHASLDMRLFRS